MALWTALYTDPWYELRLLRHKPAPGPAPFGQVPPPKALLDAVNSFIPSEDLRGEFTEAGLGAYLDGALDSIQPRPS